MFLSRKSETAICQFRCSYVNDHNEPSGSWTSRTPSYANFTTWNLEFEATARESR